MYFVENWLFTAIIIAGIVLMNILVGKAKETRKEFRKRQEKIRRRNSDFN